MKPTPIDEPPEKKSLVEIISSLKLVTNEDDKKKLQTMFYGRVSNKFYDRCHKICSKIYAHKADWEERKDDIYQDAWIVAFEKIREFETNPNWDENESKKVILFWLGKIANNIILNLYDKEKVEKKNLEEYKYTLLTDNLPGEIFKSKYIPTYDRDKFASLWGKYNEKKRDVILACARFNTLDEENTKHLPDFVIEELTKRHNIKPEALRKIKERVLKDLKNCKIENLKHVK